MQRRQLSNLIIDPGALARTSIPFVALAAISVGTVLTMQKQVIRALEESTFFGVENLNTINSLLDLQRSVTRVGLIGIVVFCVVCVIMWIFFSHRIFGPVVPMRRHIKNLIEGNYDSRISPRKGDELRDVINDLNQLAETLAQKRKP